MDHVQPAMARAATSARLATTTRLWLVESAPATTASTWTPPSEPVMHATPLVLLAVEETPTNV